MSNKADSTIPMRASAVTAEADQWPVLQRLRCGLQQLHKPLPASVRGLFQQELRLQQLEVCPSALSWQTLDNSQALQNAVDAATFTEQALIEALEAQVQRCASGGGPASQAAAIKSEYPSQVSSARSQSPLFGGAPSSEHFATSNAAGKKALAESTGLGDALIGSSLDLSLAPDFMQAWIDEILAKSQQPGEPQIGQNSRAGLHTGHATDQSADISAGVSARIKGTDAQQVNSPKTRRTTNTNTSEASGARENHHAKVRYLSEKAPKADSPEVAPQQQPGSFFVPDFEAMDKHTGASADALSAFPSLQKIPQGMVLLQQLVTCNDKPAAHTAPTPPVPTHPSRFSRSAMSNGKEDHRQSARKDMHLPFAENSSAVSPFGVHATQASTQLRNPDPLFAESEKYHPVLQQEPDRLAELVNEALIEQALRNGVDLS